jgi:hypothetical protein
MNIQHEQTDTKGAFFIEENGTRVAEMTYSKNGDYRIIIDHTEVSESQKGKRTRQSFWYIMQPNMQGILASKYFLYALLLVVYSNEIKIYTT